MIVTMTATGFPVMIAVDQKKTAKVISKEIKGNVKRSA
ncbi:hypothetical protein HNR74_002644 [Flammeovirga kamogawensis]|nr:hypothetical protein [Flammeovirga kamogawensis]